MNPEVDPFAAVRPKAKAIKQADPFAAVRPKVRPQPQKQAEEPGMFGQLGRSLKKDLGEIPGQAAKGTAKGFLGTYGDILDTLGLQAREGQTAPGEAAIAKEEAKASPQQLALMQDEDILPRYTQLPTSEGTSKAIEKLGGPGQAKTPAGRAASRAGQLIGGGAAFGTPQPGVGLAAGAIGQGLEEAGAPKWLQAAAEIGTYLKSGKKGGVASNTPEVEQQLDRLRRLNYSEEDLTLAKNALEERGWLKKTATITGDAEKRFAEATTNAEKTIDSILEGSFPGIKTEGPQALQKAAGDIFDNLDTMAKNVVVEKPESFTKNAEKAIDRLKNTLANTPQEKEVISVLESAIASAQPGRPADVYTRFYKGLNQIGRWGSPKEREYVFTTVKDAIKQTLKDQGPQGKALANQLEEANKSWIKYLRAQDVSDLMAKAVTEDGTNFTKLARLIDNPNNYEILSKGLGKEQAANLRQVAKSAGDTAALKKALEGSQAKQAIKGGKALALGGAVITGNMKLVAAYLGHAALSRLSTRLLTDPAYQNLQLKMIRAAKDKKWSLVNVLVQDMDKKLSAEP